MKDTQDTSCGSGRQERHLEPQGREVTVIPRIGGTLSVEDRTVIDLMNGTVFIGTTKQDGIDPLCKRATFLYINSNGAFTFSLDDGNTFRMGGSGMLRLRDYPGGFRIITINKPSATRTVWLVASSHPDFDIPSSVVG